MRPHSRALHAAADDAQITKRVKSHMLRHTFGTDLLAAGYDIRQIQDLFGHTDVRTTMVYTYVIVVVFVEIINVKCGETVYYISGY